MSADPIAHLLDVCRRIEACSHSSYEVDYTLPGLIDEMRVAMAAAEGAEATVRARTLAEVAEHLQIAAWINATAGLTMAPGLAKGFMVAEALVLQHQREVVAKGDLVRLSPDGGAVLALNRPDVRLTVEEMAEVVRSTLVEKLAEVGL